MPDEAPGAPAPSDPETTLVGHDSAERQLLEAWASGRFPHAWLITGPKGVGKATFAYRVARFVLAQGGPDAPPEDMFGGPPASLEIDPASRTARQVAAGGHPDFRCLQKPEDKTVISVEQARDIVEFAGKTAAFGGWKVVIVDSADALNRNSANALLKALEEPVSNGLFLLIAHAPGRLLPTIRSRCRTLALSRLGGDAMADVLARQFPDLPETERQVVAALSDGCPGKAIGLAAHGGADLYRAILELCRTPHRLDMIRVLRLGDQLARKDAEETFAVLAELLDFGLTRAIRAAAAGEGLADIVPGDAAIWTGLLSAGSLSAWLDAADDIRTGLAKAGPPSYLGRKHVLVDAFVRLEEAAKAA